ncbi:MAG: hypothetical protein IPI33_11565 [Dehalococcoidia bacterium]|nr:hypothetical protein [Dehalococcoidia bacterium]
MGGEGRTPARDADDHDHRGRPSSSCRARRRSSPATRCAPLLRRRTAAARPEAFGADPAERLVVVAGATQGATAINNAVLAGLESLLSLAVVHHITGAAGLAAAQAACAALPSALRPRYQVAAFRDDLPELMVAADLGVRAGASVLGEVPAAALPSILIPGPSRAATSGTTPAGSPMRAPQSCSKKRIWRASPRVSELLSNPERLRTMRDAASRPARPDAAGAIAGVVLEVARK